VNDPKTLLSQLSRGEDAAAALSAPEMKPLTWRALRELAARTIDSLNAIPGTGLRKHRHYVALREHLHSLGLIVGGDL